MGRLLVHIFVPSIELVKVSSKGPLYIKVFVPSPKWVKIFTNGFPMNLCLRISSETDPNSNQRDIYGVDIFVPSTELVKVYQKVSYGSMFSEL